MFLGTTAISEFWPTDEPILFIGKWCLVRAKEHEWKYRDYSVLPYHFDDREELYTAIDYCNNVYEEFLALLIPLFNDMHGVNRGERYWRIILGPWLYHYIQILYDRYLSIKIATDQYPDIKTIGLDEESYITPSSTWNFLQMVTDDPYNLQLYSQIFHGLGEKMIRKNYTLNRKVTGIDCSEKLHKKLLKKFLMSSIFTHLCGSLFLRNPIWSYHLSLSLGLQLKAQFSLMYPFFPLELFLSRVDNVDSPEINFAKRNLLQNIEVPSGNEFYVLLKDLLAVNMPIELVEMYSVLKKNFLPWTTKYSPKVMISAVGYEVSGAWRLLAAEKAESGTKLIGIQHGGAYGSFRYNPIETHELKIMDEWWTWGWEKKENSIPKPMPHPNLSNIAKIHKKKKKGNLLIVVNNYPRYLYRMWSNPIGPQTLKYHDWLNRFIEEIIEKLMPEMLVRLHPNDYATGQRDYIQKKFRHLQLDDHSLSFYKRLANANLVVCDNNHTTFLEALVANKPTVVFWKPGLWEIRPEAQPYFDELNSVGVLHNSPESAAEKVNNIYHITEDWWNNPEIQDTRKRFVRRFALSSDDWPKQWKLKLAGLVKKKTNNMMRS